MPAFFREPKRVKRVFSFKCSRDTLKLPVEETRVPKNVYSCTISMCVSICGILGRSLTTSRIKFVMCSGT